MPVRSIAPSTRRLFLIAAVVLILSMEYSPTAGITGLVKNVSLVLQLRVSDKVSGMNTDKSNSDYPVAAERCNLS